MSDRLITDLRSLAEVIDVPEPASVAARVLADPRVDRQARRPGRALPAWPRIAIGVAAVLAVVLVFPAPRHAIASLLGLGGTSITVVDELPTAVSAGRPPGESVGLDEVGALAGFQLLVPDVRPDEVVVDLGAPAPIVTLLFGDRLVITEFARPLQAEVLEKSVLATSVVEEVLVDGDEGYWIVGEHVLTYLDDVGAPREVPPRLVANTLLFEREGVTVRIETAGSLEEALAVAASLGIRD
jgi:hypothetical protein